MKKQQEDITKLIKVGQENEWITESDAKAMMPPGEKGAGRLYGLPKIHKGIPVGKNIPKCRPIVSQSGSNTEGISKYVDSHAKDLMRRIESYVEDIPDMLRQFEEQIVKVHSQKMPSP